MQKEEDEMYKWQKDYTSGNIKRQVVKARKRIDTRDNENCFFYQIESSPDDQKPIFAPILTVLSLPRKFGIV